MIQQRSTEEQGVQQGESRREARAPAACGEQWWPDWSAAGQAQIQAGRRQEGLVDGIRC